MPRFRGVIACLLLLGGCSANPQIRELQEAEAHEKRGNHEQALAAYLRAQESCTKLKGRHRRKACGAAHLQYAELLVTIGNFGEARDAYTTAEDILRDDRPAAAQARYNLSLVLEKLGDSHASQASFWQTVVRYPQEAFAADALKRIRDAERERPEEFRARLRNLLPMYEKTPIGDNVLAMLAELEEQRFENPRRARDYYDQLVRLFGEESGYFDDALWHGARLSLVVDDPQGAEDRLRKLLASRKVAWGAGSYFSVWLDDAQLQIGRVQRDYLGLYGKAIRSFARLPKHYPASILRDDALYERAITEAMRGQPKKACQALSSLRKRYPESKYIARGEKEAQSWQCQQ